MFAALALVPDQKLVRAKLLALELGVALLLALWLARPKQRRAGLFDLPVALYAGSGLLFFFLSPERENSELELTRILFAAGSYFAALQLPAPLSFWRWTAAAAAALALTQGTARVTGTFGNPIFLGTYLAASVPIAMGPAVLPVAAALLLSQSRAALLGLGAAALARFGKRALGPLALAAATAWWWFKDRPSTHWLIWQDSLRMWLDAPWLGVGLGRFHIEFPAYASEALRALWPQRKVIVNFAHNEYLQVLCETGLIGLGAFLLVPVSLLRHWKRLEPAPALAALTLFTAALVSPDLRFGVSSFLAFAALGLATPAEARPIPVAWRAAGAALLLAWAGLAARPFIAHRRLKAEVPFHGAANPSLPELERRLAAEPANADLAENLAYLYAKERDWPRAIARFELVTRLDPTRPGPYNNLGNIYYLLNRPDEAIRHWRKSLQLQPDQLDANLNLGKLLYERGRLKESARHLKKALELDPGNPKARVLLKKMVE